MGVILGPGGLRQWDEGSREESRKMLHCLNLLAFLVFPFAGWDVLKRPKGEIKVNQEPTVFVLGDTTLILDRLIVPLFFHLKYKGMRGNDV